MANETDTRCAESRRTADLEHIERVAYVRRYIGAALDAETRELVVREFDVLMARLNSFLDWTGKL